MNELKCGLGAIKEIISRFEGGTIQVSQSEQQRENRMGGKNEHSFKNTWGRDGSANICVTGILKEEKR